MAKGKAYANSLITERQYEIMQLRNSGMNQEQIATKLGVTRQNISILEKRTRENLEKAMNTLNLAFETDILYTIPLKKGINILEASNTIFNEANRLGIKLRESYLSLAMIVRNTAAPKIQKGKLTISLMAYLRKNGNITILHVR